MGRIRAIVAVAGALLLGVAWHEWAYAHDHPHRYGPAKVIAVGAIAGVALAVAIWLLTSELERLSQRRPSANQSDEAASTTAKES
jgi:type VI protein secretion system component VasK